MRLARARGTGIDRLSGPRGTGLVSSDVETTSSQTVLLATVAAAACVTLVAVLVLTAWPYATATESTDPLSLDIDRVFEILDKLVSHPTTTKRHDPRRTNGDAH
ncbi:hypothetical protein ACFPJ1_09730 [Kribbella qitaiheensis]|uniref:hypothetical protein n=1 Tax=Kribbella qitaiheensis TaxID=1544730 RepID=UPI00361393EB